MANKTKPLFTIIMPTKNGAEYIEQAILSTINQTYENVELLVIDGVSTDKTIDILKKYHQRYPEKVRYISEPDKCNEEAWNKGFKLARGEIYGWLGADDVMLPNAAADVAKFFEEHPEASVVTGRCNIVDAEGNIIRTPSIKKDEFAYDELLYGIGIVSTPSTFYKREVVERVGGLDINHNTIVSDFDYWIRIAKLYKFYTLNSVLSNFRMHSSNISDKKGARMRYAKMRLATQQKNGADMHKARKAYIKFTILEGLRPVFGRFYSMLDEKIVRRNWEKPVKANPGG